LASELRASLEYRDLCPTVRDAEKSEFFYVAGTTGLAARFMYEQALATHNWVVLSTNASTFVLPTKTRV
jgi:hypothetical protein